jgi:hypothetical protein
VFHLPRDAESAPDAAVGADHTSGISELLAASAFPPLHHCSAAESPATQAPVVFVIRTAGNPVKSRPNGLKTWFYRRHAWH